MQPSTHFRDLRFLQELNRAFPGSQDFAEYLRSSIVDFDGSVVVATLFVRGLTRVRDRVHTPVRAEVVRRLSVHTDICAVIKIAHAIPEEKFFQEDCLLFGQWLRDQVNGEVLEPRSGIDPERTTDYMRLYICAYAMLIGIEFDPRAEVS